MKSWLSSPVVWVLGVLFSGAAIPVIQWIVRRKKRETPVAAPQNIGTGSSGNLQVGGHIIAGHSIVQASGDVHLHGSGPAAATLSRGGRVSQPGTAEPVLSRLECEMLRRARDTKADITVITGIQQLAGDLIKIDGMSFGEPDDPRGSMAATEALEKLISTHYLKLEGRGRDVSSYRLTTAGWKRAESLDDASSVIATDTPTKAGDVSITGNLVAGTAELGPGGSVRAEGGTGHRGASGGNVKVGPGTYRAGDGGPGGKGGDIIIKGGDAE